MSMMRSQFSQFGGGSAQFPDPFLDIATTAMPQNIRSALRWAEYIYGSYGPYRMAMERIISYFLTDVEVGDSQTHDDVKDKWTEYLTDKFDIFTHMQNSLRNRMCYGNSFRSLIVAFRRYLTCPKCFASHPLNVVHDTPDFKFLWNAMQFTATCPRCHFSGAWRVVDRTEASDKRVIAKMWNPHEIEILHDTFTDSTAYFWRIPEDYKSQIRKGNLYHLERVPIGVLAAIRKNQMFRFDDDALYHMKEPTLGGIRNRGWGIPRILSNFRQIYYVQVLRRYNEAIALDYVVPFRLITPAPRPGGAGGSGGGAVAADPLMSYNMGSFRSQVNQMVAARRRDPARWNVLPFPVQYQMIGGDAKALAPVELIDQGLEQLLNDAGTPAELYKGSLQIQAVPVALRLFEATWHHLVHDANAELAWIARQLSRIMSWEDTKVKLRRVTIADDINKQMAMLQLMAGNQMSGTTAYKSLGLDWRAEQRQMGDEAAFQAKVQGETQKSLDQAGFASQMLSGNVVPGAGGAPANTGPGGAQPQGGGAAGAASAMGGAGAGAGPVDSFLAQMSPNTPVQPQDLTQAAETIAQQLLGLPEGVKDSQLRLLKQKNEVLHSIVRARLDAIRRDTRNRGGAMLMAQQYGGGQPPQ